MKTKTILLSLFILFCMGDYLKGQDITTNRNAVGLEHNLLFNATERFTVTQTGSAKLYLERMFDGRMVPSYTATGPTASDKTVIEISGLPRSHTQAGAWVGWSTRYWPASRFKIEGFDEYYGNGWTVLADYENKDYTGGSYIAKCKGGAYTKLRYTFYKATGTSGRLGVSELFFIHPEATTPYNGLFVSAKDSWKKSSANIYYNTGNVGIDTDSPDYPLDVAGTIRAQEVIVEIAAPAPDYVFEPDYNLRSLSEVETFVKENKHLPDVPAGESMEENGIGVAEMNMLLLQKVEELTLYVIEQNKKMEGVINDNESMKQEIKILKGKITE